MTNEEKDEFVDNIYLEEQFSRFREGDANVKEEVIEELKINGFIDEAVILEDELEEKRAWDKGSEDGMDALQDK